MDLEELENKYLEKLDEIRTRCGDSQGEAHIEADEMIAELLLELGMVELSDAYEQGTFVWWYS